ncbi:S8 family serine peptidase [Stenotrophomonas sp. PFBMAA-4]|uniref:S8 family serine peptidase n=1 Tax=Stenotrophomonas sp. PFBMAA-4 TaxID=3043301 RepID=UPI0024B595FA|nr:S8 family serine peptidase [Stenotrophomonas sp. PFBMAA-4]MDI9272435.1 S8 family serine peptidase [Stenotrophomonas sp. PFBMAA-4]
MLINKPLAAAIASLLLATGVNAAPRLDTTKVVKREATTPATAGQASAGQRFIVKMTSRSSQGRAALSSSLSSSSRRAGISVGIAATSSSPARPAASAQVLRSMASPGWYVVKTSRKLTASETANFVRELAAEPGVSTVQVDQLYQPLDVGTRAVQPRLVPNDPQYGTMQWNFHDATGGVRAEQAWDKSTGQGVVVAVVDTGVVQNTPDLAANVLPGYDMISDHLVSRRDTDERVAGGWDMGDWVEESYCTQMGAPPHVGRASSWHGTHVSGTIAQQTNNGAGLAGLAHGAKVLPVRVLGSCGGYGSDISDGILWAAGATVEGLPVNPNPAEVINMSLGSSAPQACPQIYQDAINQVNAMGVVVVVAAGNSNADAGTYTMSSCDGVISVGASRVTGGKASYSSWGSRVDLAAPGGGGSVDGDPQGFIFQVINAGATQPTDQFSVGGYTGTSMASPHVAAAAALVQSVAPVPLKWNEMRDLLKRTARPFPAAIPASTPIGVGILDANALVTAATAEPCDPKTEDCTPPAVDLSNKVELRNLTSASGDVTYRFTAVAGKPLTVMTLSGSGNASLYVAAGRVPTSSDFDASSTRATNTETIRIASPKAGTYYIRMTGNFSGLTLVARQ